jgi:hypothetical protein
MKMRNISKRLDDLETASLRGRPTLYVKTRGLSAETAEAVRNALAAQYPGHDILPSHFSSHTDSDSPDAEAWTHDPADRVTLWGEGPALDWRAVIGRTV